MKNIAAVVVALGSLVAASQANATPPAPYNWSGFYIGLNAGGVWGHEVATTLTTTPLSTAGTQTPGNVNGALFGFHGGFNMQLAPSWIVGVEGDWSWTNASDSAVNPAKIPGSFTGGRTDQNWFAILAGRVGFATMDGWLIYGKAGGAWTNADYAAFAAGPITESAMITVDRSGWMAGGGIERMLDRNWSIKAEYNYLDFGTDRILFVFPLGTNGADVNTHFHIFKFGLNYFIRP